MFFAPSNGPTSIVCGQQDCWHAASIAPEFWALEIVTTVMALKDQHFRKDHCILASAAELVSILILGTALCHMSDPMVGLGLLRGSKRPCQGLKCHGRMPRALSGHHRLASGSPPPALKAKARQRRKPRARPRREPGLRRRTTFPRPSCALASSRRDLGCRSS